MQSDARCLQFVNKTAGKGGVSAHHLNHVILYSSGGGLGNIGRHLFRAAKVEMADDVKDSHWCMLHLVHSYVTG